MELELGLYAGFHLRATMDFGELLTAARWNQAYIVLLRGHPGAPVCMVLQVEFQGAEPSSIVGGFDSNSVGSLTDSLGIEFRLTRPRQSESICLTCSQMQAEVGLRNRRYVQLHVRDAVSRSDRVGSLISALRPT
jgi:hypothetical protein